MINSYDMIVTTNWSRKLAQKSIKAIMDGPYDVAGVLAFKDGERMDHAAAIKLFGAFWHKVDRVFFGRAADKGWGINRLCFLEFGRSQKCIHVHFVAQSLIDPQLFCAILNTIWHELNDKNAELKDNWITPILAKQPIAEYVTKEVWRFRDDIHVLRCDHANVDTTDYTKFDADAQISRITNRINADRLQRAYELIPIHVICINARLKRRIAKAQAKEQRQQANMATATQSFQKFIQSRQSQALSSRLA